MELVFTVLILACLQSFALPDSQGDALIALKTSLKASVDQLVNWNGDQVNPCTWANVRCDSNNIVRHVTLLSMGFTGTLSPKVGTLKSLLSLQLPGNRITGEIPKEFGNLTSLESLDLSNNSLIGEIPSSLGNLKALQFLTLSQNNLNGTIPESLSSLPKLITLQLDSNDLSGQIPEHLVQIPTYKYEQH